MTCAESEAELVAFQFGELHGEARVALELHIVGCPRCVTAFLAHKRDMELAESEPGPSEAARSRLRAAVVQQLYPPRASLWERPLAFAFASVVVVVALGVTHAVATSPGAAPRFLLAPAP